MNMPARAKPSSRLSEQPRGMALLRDPLLNKGTAFTEAERDALGIGNGLVRISVGCEDADDLLADLGRALRAP